MGLICVCQTLGMYKHFRDVPLWQYTTQAAADYNARHTPDADADADGAEAAGDKSGDESDDDAQAADPRAAENAACRMEHGQAQADEDHCKVKARPGKQDMGELRKQYKNTLALSVAILSRDNIRNLVVVILEICRPIWTAHSEHARVCRAPRDVLAFYIRAARSDWLRPLEESARVFLDIRKLTKMGFITDYTKGLDIKKMAVTDPFVQAEKVNCYHMFNLWCNTTLNRIGSMMWHSHNWVGAMVMMSVEEVYDSWVAKFGADYRVYLDIIWQVEGQPLSAFIVQLVEASPFKTRLVLEIANMVTLPLMVNYYHSEDYPNPMRQHIQSLCSYLFESWGQTKVVEDTFRNCRQREEDTHNGIAAIPLYYQYMSEMGGIQLHERVEISPSEDGPG